MEIMIGGWKRGVLSEDRKRKQEILKKEMKDASTNYKKASRKFSRNWETHKSLFSEMPLGEIMKTYIIF